MMCIKSLCERDPALSSISSACWCYRVSALEISGKVENCSESYCKCSSRYGELPYHKRCDELTPVCMVKRKLRMGFDQSTSTVWEQGGEERLLEQLWLVELVPLSHV